MTDGQGVGLSPHPWDEICYNLWMGGMYFGPQMTPCAPNPGDFDLVVSMAGRGDDIATRVSDDIAQENYYIEDAKLGLSELSLVWDAYDVVKDSVLSGNKTLVRCQAGWNRSGLVVGLVTATFLYDTGVFDSPYLLSAAVLDLVRDKRGPNALSNDHFVGYIEDHIRSLHGRND